MNLLVYVPQMAAYGGMERHLCLVVEAAAQAGAQVTLITTSNSLAEDWRQRLLGNGVELRELPLARGAASKLEKTVWLALHSLRLRRRRWDMIYTNGQSVLARLPWLAARKGTRRLHHHHTAADAAEQATWHPGFLRVLRQAGELVGCSQFTADHLNAATGRTDARFLPYFTESAFADALPPALPPRAEDEPLRFGFLGRLVSTKGIETILRLAADPDCAGIEWHIHGAGEDYPPARFAGQASVVYHGGYAGPAEQAVALGRLDAVALFSVHNEGMPLSLIETMAAGLPWVATARGGTPELAEARPDCELIARPDDYLQCRDAVMALARRIRSGATSRARQRAVWERRFAPAVVRTAWLHHLGIPVSG